MNRRMGKKYPRIIKHKENFIIIILLMQYEQCAEYRIFVPTFLFFYLHFLCLLLPSSSYPYIPPTKLYIQWHIDTQSKQHNRGGRIKEIPGASFGNFFYPNFKSLSTFIKKFYLLLCLLFFPLSTVRWFFFSGRKLGIFSCKIINLMLEVLQRN